MGYKMAVGDKWKGLYLVAPMEDFDVVSMLKGDTDVDACTRVLPMAVSRIWPVSLGTQWEFPLAERYTDANSTMTGRAREQEKMDIIRRWGVPNSDTVEEPTDENEPPQDDHDAEVTGVAPEPGTLGDGSPQTEHVIEEGEAGDDREEKESRGIASAPPTVLRGSDKARVARNEVETARAEAEADAPCVRLLGTLPTGIFPHRVTTRKDGTMNIVKKPTEVISEAWYLCRGTDFTGSRLALLNDWRSERKLRHAKSWAEVDRFLREEYEAFTRREAAKTAAAAGPEEVAAPPDDGRGIAMASHYPADDGCGIAMASRSRGSGKGKGTRQTTADCLQVRCLNPRAEIPKRASTDAAGYDLHACDTVVIKPGSVIAVPTGISIRVPAGTCGMIKSRSGLAWKKTYTSPPE